MHFPPSVCIRLPYVKLSCDAVYMSIAFDLQTGRSGNPDAHCLQVSSPTAGARTWSCDKMPKSSDTYCFGGMKSADTTRSVVRQICGDKWYKSKLRQAVR